MIRSVCSPCLRSADFLDLDANGGGEETGSLNLSMAVLRHLLGMSSSPSICFQSVILDANGGDDALGYVKSSMFVLRPVPRLRNPN